MLAPRLCTDCLPSFVRIGVSPIYISCTELAHPQRCTILYIRKVFGFYHILQGSLLTRFWYFGRNVYTGCSYPWRYASFFQHSGLFTEIISHYQCITQILSSSFYDNTRQNHKTGVIAIFFKKVYKGPCGCLILHKDPS